jgi:uncharacterized protein YoaH (UPF0181 family)
VLFKCQGLPAVPPKIQGGRQTQNQNFEEINRLIAEGIKNAIPTIAQALRENEPSTHNKPITQTDRDERHSYGDDNSEFIASRKRKKQEGCIYRTFQPCKPAEFSGNGGAIATIRWLEKIEPVLAISKCADKDIVLFASHSFKDEALE